MHERNKGRSGREFRNEGGEGNQMEEEREGMCFEGMKRSKEEEVKRGDLGSIKEGK